MARNSVNSLCVVNFEVLQMIASDDFLRSVMNSISEHIVVIDREGVIRFVNTAWVTFGQDNGCLIKNNAWLSVNYLKVCDESAALGEEYAREAAEGIRRVVEHALVLFCSEYPCHSPNEKRWFTMRVTPFQLEDVPYCVISHQNITERKLAEEQVLNQSRVDGLTRIPNRRYLEEFLEAEWKRCSRLNLPIAIAVMDIDHFKLLNDHYGHQAGDECLAAVGAVLNKIGKRPGDIFARYGGEEFLLVFGNTTTEQSLVPINGIVDAIRELKIPNEKSPTKPIVTVSIGLAMMHPNKQNNEKDLIKAADKLLYSAKNQGRNRVVFN
jgi:diguanylate cyclase (GGDEF)-like protein/PAS domain S-box-containing protein